MVQFVFNNGKNCNVLFSTLLKSVDYCWVIKTLASRLIFLLIFPVLNV